MDNDPPDIWVIDLTYSDGSLVRLHSRLPSRATVLAWLRANKAHYQRPGLSLASILVQRGVDGAAL